jgi:hypothetical protein
MCYLRTGPSSASGSWRRWLACREWRGVQQQQQPVCVGSTLPGVADNLQQQHPVCGDSLQEQRQQPVNNHRQLHVNNLPAGKLRSLLCVCKLCVQPLLASSVSLYCSCVRVKTTHMFECASVTPPTSAAAAAACPGTSPTSPCCTCMSPWAGGAQALSCARCTLQR